MLRPAGSDVGTCSRGIVGNPSAGPYWGHPPAAAPPVFHFSDGDCSAIAKTASRTRWLGVLSIVRAGLALVFVVVATMKSSELATLYGEAAPSTFVRMGIPMFVGHSIIGAVHLWASAALRAAAGTRPEHTPRLVIGLSRVCTSLQVEVALIILAALGGILMRLVGAQA